MVRLRRSNGMFSEDDDWKVTAHYVVHMTAKKRLACVRVSNYDAHKAAVAPYAVMHLSLREFRRLFRPRTKKEYDALMREVRREMIRRDASPRKRASR